VIGPLLRLRRLRPDPVAVTDGNGLLDLVLQVETENLDPGQFDNGYVSVTGWT